MKMSKYNAIKTTVDGITFDSRKEASRYTELKLLSQAGEIRELRRQVPFELIPKRGKLRAIRYVADFVYADNHGNDIVEDVKGMKTQVYKLKKRMMLEKYGIEIQEV